MVRWSGLDDGVTISFGGDGSRGSLFGGGESDDLIAAAVVVIVISFDLGTLTGLLDDGSPTIMTHTLLRSWTWNTWLSLIS